MKNHVTKTDITTYLKAGRHFINQQSMLGDGISMAEQTRRRLDEWTPGIKAAAFDKGRGSRGPGDPTGQQAAKHPDLADTLARQYAHAWQQLASSIQTIERITAWAHTHADPLDRATNDRKVYICANPWCRDDVLTADGEVPTRGRCKPCADYQAEHGRDASHRTIKERRRYRENAALQH